MQPPIEIAPPHLTLLCFPAGAARLLLHAAAHLAARGPLLVLDGGNHFDVYPVARELRRAGTPVEAALGRIQIARAFTCFQMDALIQGTPEAGPPLLALDPLATFYDENVPLVERRRLLDRCRDALARLSRTRPVGVAVLARPDPDGLLARLAQSAGCRIHLEALVEPPAPRLF